jgi:putative SOS response-associated peptidase YedK
MPTILTKETAEAWISPDISEKEIHKLATYHTSGTLLATIIRKDFREIDNPMEPFLYEELPPLKVG